MSNPSLKSRKIPHDQSHDHLQYIDQFAVEFYQYTVNGKVSWMFAAQKPNWPWKSILCFFRNYFKIFENYKRIIWWSFYKFPQHFLLDLMYWNFRRNWCWSLLGLGLLESLRERRVLKGKFFKESLRLNWNFQSEGMWGGSSQKLFSVL